MLHREFLPAALALAGLFLALAVSAPPAHAQSNDPAAQRLIDQLRPGTGGSRGIRVPLADEGRAAPPGAVTPQPSQPSGAPAARAPATTAPTTTAPAGAAAVSMTVNFPSGSATLTPGAAQALGPLGRALSSAELRPFRFRIEGHTDSVGDAEGNQLLSERRAEAVRAHLIQAHRVPPARLEAVGLGEGRLLVPTADGVHEPRNRRVQIINIGEQ